MYSGFYWYSNGKILKDVQIFVFGNSVLENNWSRQINVALRFGIRVWWNSMYYCPIPKSLLLFCIKNYRIMKQALYKVSLVNTVVFGKVYRTIVQCKRRRLVLKTGVIMYIQKDIKIIRNISKYIFTYIYICYKINHNIFFFVNSIDK